ncbi:MAG: hydroxymethylbilane synthase [Bdellovibrionales bacterium RIFOXYD1_FULL_53_11]|nr:MAG: hydroxymethylbilane synthase [Bdellovibrionales bacterium RIFOXYD1_FULL_53_11]
MTPKTLRLGTRRSLLAMTQSRIVAAELGRSRPDVSIEIIGIETKGDKLLDVPLHEIEGKEFFTAELDEALLEGRVDFTVNSLKDMSIERHPELHTAAIPARAEPHDVIVFGPSGTRKLLHGGTITIGSSSLRRLENIPPFLAQALPHGAGASFADIRGNVNTRLSRLHDPEGGSRHFDAVVLAFAGIERLLGDQFARDEVKGLLSGTKLMLLPLSLCPTAPGQGALSIECRRADRLTTSVLQKLHDPAAHEAVSMERALLIKHGGGCHQKFGATASNHKLLGLILHTRGPTESGMRIDGMHWSIPEPRKCPALDRIAAWDGSAWRNTLTSHRIATGLPENMRGKPVFVSHSRAVDDSMLPSLRSARVWTSGVQSWFRLARLGVFVEGCAEGLGFDHLSPVFSSGLAGLGDMSDWTVLTHKHAENDWLARGCSVLPSYRLERTGGGATDKMRGAIKQATHVFWSSGSQFDELKDLVSHDAVHACGPGKTAVRIRNKGIKPFVFPSKEEWKKWIDTH